MSIPVPRAPKTRFAAPARAVPAPEEVSAGGLIIDFDRPEELPAAIIARIKLTGYPVASLGTLAYWFTSNGLRIH